MIAPADRASGSPHGQFPGLERDAAEHGNSGIRVIPALLEKTRADYKDVICASASRRAIPCRMQCTNQAKDESEMATSIHCDIAGHLATMDDDHPFHKPDVEHLSIRTRSVPSMPKEL